jgi:hypothetical protein
MKNNSLRRLVGLLIALSLTTSFSLAGTRTLLAPQKDDETLISEARAELQNLLSAPPPSGSAPETPFKVSVVTARQKLRDLLLQKKGLLRGSIRTLQSSSNPASAYLASLQRELDVVNTELGALDQALTQSGVIVNTTIPPTPTPAATPTNAQIAFDANVKKLSETDLTKAAAPKAVVETALTPAPCLVGGKPNRPFASKYEGAICGLAIDIDARRSEKYIHLRRHKGDLFPILIAKLLKANASESYVSFVTQAQEQRVDQQIGAGPGSQGTTSLVVKGGVPYLFGLAVENGAATQSQSDTTITYRVNPAGMLNLIQKKGFISGFRQNDNDPFLKVLGKTSLGFTFDTNRGSTPGVFTGDKQQLSAFSARIEFVNERDPRLKKYERDWERFVSEEQVKLSDQISNTSLALNEMRSEDDEESFKDPALQAWLIQTNNIIRTVDQGLPYEERVSQTAKILRQRADLLPVDLVSAETTQAVTDFAKRFLEYTQKKNELLERIARGKIFTLEYTNTRGVNAPDLSNINFIAATGMGARIDLTANGSFTFFNKQPLAATPGGPQPGRVRDFQFAGQVTIPFKVGDGQFDFWFSGRYERLLENASTQLGTIVPGTKGDIAVGQFGLNIPIKSLGIKFPVSVTFANRTELIKEKEVRGNIGFTFNWDTLFSRLKPF